MKFSIHILNRGLLILVAMLPVACVREIGFSDDSEHKIERELVIEAAWGDENAPGTRTAIQDDFETVLWTPAEEINLFQGTSASGHFTSTNTEPARKIQFEGVLYGQTDPSAPYWAIYPYNEGNTCNGNSVTMTVPSNQTAFEGTFADKFFPAVAKSDNMQMQFYNICGGAVFSVVHQGILSVEFSSNGNEPLAGKVTVSMDNDGYPVVDEILESSSTVIVTLPDGAAFEVGKKYYAAFLPRTLSQGIKITYHTSSASVSLIHDQAITVNRSRFGILTNKDKGLDLGESVGILEAVDLGLPSGLKWASFNLGANRPEGYGDYFAWGETEPKEDYSWSNYKWCMGNFRSLTKYNTNSLNGYNGFTDGKTVLDPEDDAASANLGDKWRMPTKEEQDELREMCSWEWTQLNEVSGYKVVGPNGKSIFLPASGLMDGTSFRPSFNEPDPYGEYWSSTISAEVDEDTYCSYLLVIYQINKGCYLSNRRYGYTIRPVFDSRTRVESVSLNETSITVKEGMTKVLTATVYPLDATDKSVTWESSDQSIAMVSASGVVTGVSPGTAKISVTTVDGGKTATCNVTVRELSYAVPEAVDLGLSVKWASFSLGAITPEENGDLFAWGETQTKNLFWVYNYLWYSSSEKKYTKYNWLDDYGIVDNKIFLDMEDDAAYVLLGGEWRMPTHHEMIELIYQCDWTYVDNYQGSGISGCIVRGKKEGYTGNSIFIPSGVYQSSSLQFSEWTITGPYAQEGMSVGGDNIESWNRPCVSSTLYRSDGWMIRPVSGPRSSWSILPLDVQFGEVPVGTTTQQSVLITNTGDSSIEMKVRVNSPFSLDVSSIALNKGESTTITVSFTPTEAVDYKCRSYVSYWGSPLSSWINIYGTGR